MTDFKFELEVRIKTLFMTKLETNQSTPLESRVLVNPSPNIAGSGWERDGVVTPAGITPSLVVVASGIATLVTMGVQSGVFKDVESGIAAATEHIRGILDSVEDIRQDSWKHKSADA